MVWHLMVESRVNARAQAVRSPGRAGFTIVEVMVILGVVFLLLAIAFPALRSMVATGRQVEEMNAARHLMIAYRAYAVDHRDRVMPGYKDSGLTARDMLGRPITSGLVAGRYPWRILPYLDLDLRGLYLGNQSDLLDGLEEGMLSDEGSVDYQFQYLYTVSLFPSLGLNTAWLGGDAEQGAFQPNDEDIRTYGQYYVTTLSTVRRTDRLLVFASARTEDTSPFGGGGLVEGFHRVLSPFRRDLDPPRWSETYDPEESPDRFGYLSPRHDGRVVAVFVDGHTTAEEIEAFRDMRMWANGATSEGWTLETP